MRFQLLFLPVFFVLFVFNVSAQEHQKKLRFAFMTDIHLNAKNDGDRLNGLKQALQKVKESDVDFIVLGGDQLDISGMGYTLDKKQVDSLYTVLKKTLDENNQTYYPTIGNHDRHFDAQNGFSEGDEVFKRYFKESYYTFEDKGIRFFILNSVQPGGESGGYVGEKQMNWLKEQLKAVSPETPIVVSTHVPVYSIYYPVVEGKYVFMDVIANYKELLKAFEGHHLNLVLQGHQHLYEEIFSQDVHYITGGAVCAGWWGGAFHGTEEGFLLVEVDQDNQFTWKYIDYGWTPRP